MTLIERVIGHVVEVFVHADDSNGEIGSLTQEPCADRVRIAGPMTSRARARPISGARCFIAEAVGLNPTGVLDNADPMTVLSRWTPAVRCR